MPCWRIEDGRGFFLAQRVSVVRREFFGVAFDGVEPLYPREHGVGAVDVAVSCVVKFAAGMGPTRHFEHVPPGIVGNVNAVVAAIRVGVQVAGLFGRAFEVAQKFHRSVAAPTFGVVVHHIGVVAVTEISPKPALVRAAFAGLAHGDGGVVGVDDFGLDDALFHDRDDGLEHQRRRARPVAHRRAAEFHAVSREDALLAMQRQMIGVFAHDDLRQRAENPVAPTVAPEFKIDRKQALLETLRGMGRDELLELLAEALTGGKP